MTQVQTALGPVATSELGPTLMHEHIFILTADVQQNYPEEWGDEDLRVADAVRQLRALAAAGIKTIVDVTVLGQGRYIPRIRRVAEQVPELNIVVATGCYTFDDVPLFFWRRTPEVEASLGRPARDVMVDFFLRDITEGIGNTGVKAGMLKCAVDEKGLTGGVERVLRAVAQAHARTGTPISIHTHAASQHGPAILEVLTAEGVDLSRVVLGHSGDVNQPDYLESMAETGWTASASTTSRALPSALTWWWSSAAAAWRIAWCCHMTIPVTWTGSRPAHSTTCRLALPARQP